MHVSRRVLQYEPTMNNKLCSQDIQRPEKMMCFSSDVWSCRRDRGSCRWEKRHGGINHHE